jgi:hypothetical protein
MHAVPREARDASLMLGRTKELGRTIKRSLGRTK